MQQTSQFHNSAGAICCGRTFVNARPARDGCFMYGERRTTMSLKHMPLRFGLLGLLLFLASASVMMAQTTATTGALTGLVTDPSGAVVPKAKATLKSKTTGAIVTTDGNASGQY